MAKINDQYDIGAAFEAIENELIRSMIRNFKNHKQEEIDEKKHWSMWQTEMLKSLEKYKHDNQEKYGKQFRNINKQIAVLISLARTEGGMNQEKRILEEIKNGFKAKRITNGGTSEFFKVNDRKLNALIDATTSDMQKAEVAVLRMANDQYRKIIYNAQVYANTGAGTYEKAVDMATKDFLSAGLNCVEYANGTRHTISDYADMAIRTASKRAYLQGEGEMRQQWGLHLVIMNKRGSPCPKCLPFVGKILIDDVWSGGSSKDGKYPLMSSAVAAGLYHPRCKDSHTTYFPGITKVDPKYNKQEISNLEDQAQQEAKQQYAERQEKRFGRLADFSLDPENKQKYEQKRKEWKHVRMRTGNMDTAEYLDERRREQFLGIPENITSVWCEKDKCVGKVTDLQEYIVGKEKYKVDGKNILLDYSAHEKKVAENIAEKYGKKIQMVPRIVYPQGISTPDFKIDDVSWDLKTISTAGKNVFYNAVKKKKRQAGCFIFDITDCPLPKDEIQQQIKDLFRSTHLTFIDQIALYKDDGIIGVYKRNKK